MKNFLVTQYQEIYKDFIVEAENEEEAEIAFEKGNEVTFIREEIRRIEIPFITEIKERNEK